MDAFCLNIPYIVYYTLAHFLQYNEVNKGKKKMKKIEITDELIKQETKYTKRRIKMTLKQQDIANTIINQYDYISKINAIKFIKSVFGSTVDLRDIVIAYNSIEW